MATAMEAYMAPVLPFLCAVDDLSGCYGLVKEVRKTPWWEDEDHLLLSLGCYPKPRITCLPFTGSGGQAAVEADPVQGLHWKSFRIARTAPEVCEGCCLAVM